MYDIVIIGAGPGGSTMARMLDKKYKVLLVDKRNLDENTNYKREICCGGLLAPDAQKALAWLGLGVPKEVLTGPQMFSVKSLDFDNKLERYYQRHYINIDREKFDRWLVSLVPENVEVDFDSIYKDYKEVEGHVEVNLKTPLGNRIVKTRLLIGADGAMSKVRRQTFKKSHVPETYVSIQRWYMTSDEMPYYTSIFDKDVTDFYSWIIQKNNKILVGSAIPKHYNAGEKFDLLIEKLKASGYQIGEEYKREGSLIMRTRNPNQINAVRGNVALIGEAAGFISPSSAEGISYALKTGAALATSINGDSNNFKKEYSKTIKKLKFNILIKNVKVLLMYNNFTRLLIMKSKVLSMDVRSMTRL